MIYTRLAVFHTVNAPASLEVKYLHLGRITQATAESGKHLLFEIHTQFSQKKKKNTIKKAVENLMF